MPAKRIHPLPSVGDKFGRLTVIGTPFSKGPRCRWFVECCCECGERRTFGCDDLRMGDSKSCGCLNRQSSSQRFTTHGSTNTRLYGVWKTMKTRCFNPNHDYFKGYGGRGITICKEWIHNFAAFRDWAMSNGYRNGLSIERKDNNGNYEPSNCKWATPKEEARNTHRNHTLTAFGETKTIAAWVEDSRCCVGYTTLHSRINFLGWDNEKAITTPSS